MTRTVFKLVEVPESEIRIGQAHVIVVTKGNPNESIQTFPERVDWACHLREGSAAVVNIGGLICMTEAQRKQHV